MELTSLQKEPVILAGVYLLWSVHIARYIRRFWGTPAENILIFLEFVPIPVTLTGGNVGGFGQVKYREAI